MVCLVCALGSHGEVGKQSDGTEDSFLRFWRQQQGGETLGAEGAEKRGCHLVVASQVDQQPECLQGDCALLPGMDDVQKSREEGFEVRVPISKHTDIGEGKQQLAQ